MIKKIVFILLGVSLFVHARGGLHVSFEMRYFTSDSKANGETDFHGETEWMTLDQRVDFLNKYATYASKFWNDVGFDKTIVSQREVSEVLKSIKPQPLTTIRRTIPLTGWKAYGYKNDHTNIKRDALTGWESGHPGIKVKSGQLVMENSVLVRETEPVNWRFRFRMTLQPVKSACSVALQGDDNRCILLQFDQGRMLVNGAPSTEVSYKPNEAMALELYGDFVNKRFFLSVNGKSSAASYPMPEGVTGIDRLEIATSGALVVDDILLFNFIRDAKNPRIPYHSSVALDEDFEEKPPIDGWQYMRYDDSAWKPVELPSVHGGLREKEEEYYLRKVVKIDAFERATLKMETVDPGGEVWVNGEVVAVVNNRHPVEIDVSRHLKQNSDNIIAVRVYHNKNTNSMLHAPLDPYIGWHLGRAELLLSAPCMFKDLFVHTATLSDEAIQHHTLVLQNPDYDYFDGSIEINYYPWFPSEGDKAATITQNVSIPPSIDYEINIRLPVKNAGLWSADQPVLYKVEAILKDREGNRIDDYVVTTGIRTIDQKDGELLLNGKPAMLNGAQIMGWRYPVETATKTNRCVDHATVVQDLLLIKKMNGNMLRLHVHAQRDAADGINDPRYAAFADQLGVYLLWQTAGWIRDGEAWNVDFKGYPKYMKQVYNHPSIVMWEGSNHPNRFKNHDISVSHDFINLMYETIASVDTSRLISPTSYWTHTHYGNYDGSIDYQGNAIEPNPVLMKKMMTRGNQDTYTGYDAKWTALREAPNSWAASCLAANDKAYFNFEHEESAAQPNWNLAIREPWYQVQSYEWGYDEGTIGRKLDVGEWKASQAWQAFSAWESMKKQILLGYDGFSWCTLESGANMFTYQKPLVDPFNVPKLAYYARKMVFQEVWAGSDNVDVVYGPGDAISPVIFSLGGQKTVELIVELQDVNGKTVDKKRFKNITIGAGRTMTKMDSFRFKKVNDGCYFIKYTVVLCQ